MADLFAVENVAPKDEKEAMQLGELVVSLIRYSAYKEAKVRKDVPEKVLRTWKVDQLAKFTAPSVKKEKGFKITYPVHEVRQLIPPTNTLIIYEIDFAEGGALKLKSTDMPVG